MIYVEIINNEIGMTCYKPFDKKDGLGKTREELEQTGLVVEALPTPETIDGKVANLKYNPTNKSLYFEYVDILPTPKTEMELLQEKVALQEQSILELSMMVTGGAV